MPKLTAEEIHAALAPFAGATRGEMDDFLARQEAGNRARAARARRRRGGTETGAPCAGDDGDQQ